MLSRSMSVQCWHCGSELKEILLPFSRREVCPHCNHDLHVCKACIHYASNLSSSCKEDRAEFVAERNKANFCEFFTPNPLPYQQTTHSEADRAKAQLAQLFGDTSPEESTSLKGTSEADRALAELKRLFGDE